MIIIYQRWKAQGGSNMGQAIKLSEYTVVDVETPNRRNNSICSIAILHVEDNEVTYSKEFLVNPEASFDDFNIGIHHITSRMVINAPVFSCIWEEIKQFFSNGLVIAHNATFDLNVIGKTLTTYDIPVPDFHYICTLAKARRHFSKERYGSHKLDVLCNAFQIELDHHHNAMCDTNACRQIFEVLSKEYGTTDTEIETYIFSTGVGSSSKKSVLQKSMNTLYGIIFGIGCDRIFNEKEYSAIFDWMEEYREFKTEDEFCECYKLLKEVLSDGVISIEEYELLMNCFNIHISSNLYSDSTLAMQVLMGIVEGIAIDKKVNAVEAKELYRWMETHVGLKGNYPFDKIFNTLEEVLENGIVDEAEEKSLLSIFEQFINPEQSLSNDIDLNGKVCCLTGTFMNGTKSDIEKYIITKGGSCISGLNRSVNYLVVGGQGSPDWKYGNYGGKINKAVQMQENGVAIQITSEETIYHTLVI